MHVIHVCLDYYYHTDNRNDHGFSSGLFSILNAWIPASESYGDFPTGIQIRVRGQTRAEGPGHVELLEHYGHLYIQFAQTPVTLGLITERDCVIDGLM